MTITSQDLPAVLVAHKKWLNGEPDGTRANLADANLTGAKLAGANLAGANLTGAKLAGANLADANLARANLTDANLTGAKLAGANLAGANLADANLADANLTDANLARAKFENTRWRGGVVITRVPLQLAGLPYIVYILDNHMQIGCELHKLADWATFDNERIARMDDIKARKFWDAYGPALLALAAADGRK